MLPIPLETLKLLVNEEAKQQIVSAIAVIYDFLTLQQLVITTHGSIRTNFAIGSSSDAIITNMYKLLGF